MSCKKVFFYLAWILTSAPTLSRCGQSFDAKLLNFQKFVNGDVPVKEAVVCRQLSDSNGIPSNREWWRFGCQNGTWFVQRLFPENNNSTNLVPTDSTVCGASFAQCWVVSDTKLHLAPKSDFGGSVIDHFGFFYRSQMYGALTLGIPRNMSVRDQENAPIKWDGLSFATTIASKWGQNNEVLATEPTFWMMWTGMISSRRWPKPAGSPCR
jgi:hypothetical protein